MTTFALSERRLIRGVSGRKHTAVNSAIPCSSPFLLSLTGHTSQSNRGSAYVASFFELFDAMPVETRASLALKGADTNGAEYDSVEAMWAVEAGDETKRSDWYEKGVKTTLERRTRVPGLAAAYSASASCA